MTDSDVSFGIIKTQTAHGEILDIGKSSENGDFKNTKIDHHQGLLLFKTGVGWRTHHVADLIIDKKTSCYPLRVCSDFVEDSSSRRIKIQNGIQIALQWTAGWMEMGFVTQLSPEGGYSVIGIIDGFTNNVYKVTKLIESNAIQQFSCEYSFNVPEKFMILQIASIYIRKRSIDDSAEGMNTRTDITIPFSATAGLVLKQDRELLKITNIDDKGSVKRVGLQVGDVVELMNGRKRTKMEAKRILDSVVFGDLIILTVLRDGERKTFRFHAE